MVGKNTKYDGKNNYNQYVIDYLKDKEYILICPEVAGGMSIPRIPSEISNNKVINKENEDVTAYFIKGAEITLDYLKKNNVSILILKSKSPSCGYKKIYDGSFTNTILDGNGIFTSLAIKENFIIYDEQDIKQIMKSKVN